MAGPGEGDSGGRPRPDSEDRTEALMQYADPVDPWATAEAAAVANDGHVPSHLADPQSPAQPNSTWTIPGAPGSETVPQPAPTRKRVLTAYRKGLLISAAAGAVALGVTAAVLLWPDFPALDFHSLDEESRYQPVGSISSLWSDAEVVGERAVFASVGDNGALGVVAVDTGSRKELWRTTITEPGVTGWDSMVATPGEVVLYSTLNASSKITMVVLDLEDGGKKLWDRPLGSSDTVQLGTENALVLDKGEGRLLWVDLQSGKVAHEEDDTDSSVIVPVTTPADLTGPTSTLGRGLNAQLTDNRVIQINGNNSVRVLDLKTGKTLKDRDSVASTSSDVLAHDGRLFVEDTTGTADRIFAYSLDELGEPVTLYTAPENATLGTFTPCGTRLCFVETDGYDRAKDRVVAVDAAKGGKAWEKPVAEVDALTPVGDSLLVTTSADTDQVTLLDSGGATEWTATGRAARLDGANILRFADPLTSSLGNRSLSGVHLGDNPVPMDEVRDVYTGSCSWNTTVLACVGKEQFLLYRFS
ncbi:PQQ-binding-like beta-propeller repeat protein [Actinoplanes sp. NPDC051861]|uniref:outer membrane protein assembly factor BamB family protein n=1 Tax=Actinoplanes sp. NPDC051861 TaxID=3155170 RepID=UPI0034179AFB